MFKKPVDLPILFYTAPVIQSYYYYCARSFQHESNVKNKSKKVIT